MIRLTIQLGGDVVIDVRGDRASVASAGQQDRAAAAAIARAVSAAARYHLSVHSPALGEREAYLAGLLEKDFGGKAASDRKPGKAKNNEVY